MLVRKIDDIEAFQCEVEQAKQRVLVKFEAEWCMPCKAMASVVEDIARKHPEVKVVAVDIEGEGLEPILKKYKVMAVPTFVQVCGGVSVKSASGTISKAELASLLEE